MKKATKVLLLLSVIFSFVCLGAFLITGLVYTIVGANPDMILEMKIQGINSRNVNEYAAAMLAVGIVLLILCILCIPMGVFSIKAKKQFEGGASKKDMKKLAILLIVFGALTFELPIVPGVFLLAMGENNFGKEEAK